MQCCPAAASTKCVHQQDCPQHLYVSQHQLARLLVEEHSHVGLLIGMGRHHKALYLGGRGRGPKGRQLGFDRPCNSAVPGAPLLLLLSLQPGISVTTPCSCMHGTHFRSPSFDA